MKIKMAVIRDNIEKCIEQGVYGCSEGRGGLNVSRLSELLPGDRIILYATGLCKFAGIVEITKSIFQDETPIWGNGLFPYRVSIKPVIYLPKNNWIDVKSLVNDLEYFKNKHQWSMHFMQNLRPVSEHDYKILLNKMSSICKELKV